MMLLKSIDLSKAQLNYVLLKELEHTTVEMN
jgi:hypothetical protein